MDSIEAYEVALDLAFHRYTQPPLGKILVFSKSEDMLDQFFCDLRWDLGLTYAERWRIAEDSPYRYNWFIVGIHTPKYADMWIDKATGYCSNKLTVIVLDRKIPVELYMILESYRAGSDTHICWRGHRIMENKHGK